MTFTMVDLKITGPIRDGLKGLDCLAENMTRVVIFGDTHLSYDDVEIAKIEELLDILKDDPPDTVVLGGDIYELWRRDLAGVMWESDWFTNAMRDLTETGTKVEYIIGNHDGWMLTHTMEGFDYPFDIGIDYTFSSGGSEFFVTHGHKYEPTYNPLVNDALSLTDDFLGSVTHTLWANRPLPENLLEKGALAALGPAASFLDPEHTSKSALRQETIHAGIQADSGDSRWGIYGHTHLPFVDEDQKIANWGSFTKSRATYIEVEDGDVRLIDLFD